MRKSQAIEVLEELQSNARYAASCQGVVLEQIKGKTDLRKVAQSSRSIIQDCRKRVEALQMAIDALNTGETQ